MNKFLSLVILTFTLLGLPILGARLQGLPVAQYLEFPPLTQYVVHEPFSWIVFLCMGLGILAFIVPFAVWASGHRLKPKSDALESASRSFPGWGYAALLWTVAWWMIAWNRFSFASAVQAHTFFPLWLGYIGVVNALCFKRTGYCSMLNDQKNWLYLFPLSASFWWFFEYLNRFVQNWSYVDFDTLTANTYFWLATLSFSTVLPAVCGTRDVLMSYDLFKQGFNSGWKCSAVAKRKTHWFLFILSCLGLLGIGAFPNYLYPLLWLAPLFILTSLKGIRAERHVLSGLVEGNWTAIVAPMLAALICGFFWELWNFYSLAKWVYHIPFVDTLHVFEMPLLGFAGYLPFGLECVVISNLLTKGNGYEFK